MTGKTNYLVPAVKRAFDIIDLISRGSIGLTATEISRQLHLPYSTTFYILSTMEQCGYVQKDKDTGRYTLGLKLFSFGGNLQFADNGIREIASPILEDLVLETRLTGHIAILEKGEAVYIDRKECQGFIKINSWIGKRNFAHCTAVGKAILAFLPAWEVRDILRDVGLPKRTEKTITSFRKLNEELERIRRRGFAIDDEEDEKHGRCIAAPIFDVQGRVIASMGIAGTVTQIPKEKFEELGQIVKKHALLASWKVGSAK